MMRSIRISRNNYKFNVNPTDYEKFWEQFSNESWEKNTTDIFDRYIDRSTIYIDIGAWIGPTLFYAAQLAGKSIAIEADPIAFKRLNENLSMNSKEKWYANISLINKVVSNKSGNIRFGSQGEGGDSMSSLLWAGENTTWEIEAITPEEILSRSDLKSNKVFIKIDIEGGEFTMLDELKKIFAKKNAIIFLSLHNKFLKLSLVHKYKNHNYWSRWFNIRRDFVCTYRKFFDVLPYDKNVTIGGKLFKANKLIYFYMFLFCRPPREKKFRELLIKDF